MPITFRGEEYLTTQEGMELTGIKTSATWKHWTEHYGFQHATRVGKRNQHLWRKSDVEKMLGPVETKANEH